MGYKLRKSRVPYASVDEVRFGARGQERTVNVREFTELSDEEVQTLQSLGYELISGEGNGTPAAQDQSANPNPSTEPETTQPFQPEWNPQQQPDVVSDDRSENQPPQAEATPAPATEAL